MNRTIIQALASSAAFAGAAALFVVWNLARRDGRHSAKRQMREQLKTWEGEGGNLAPAQVRDTTATAST